MFTFCTKIFTFCFYVLSYIRYVLCDRCTRIHLFTFCKRLLTYSFLRFVKYLLRFVRQVKRQYFSTFCKSLLFLQINLWLQNVSISVKCYYVYVLYQNLYVLFGRFVKYLLRFVQQVKTSVCQYVLQEPPPPAEICAYETCQFLDNFYNVYVLYQNLDVL